MLGNKKKRRKRGLRGVRNFFYKAEGGIRGLVQSRGLGSVF